MNNKIVSQNIGMVKALARKFSGRGVDAEDLVQEGCIGLLKAQEKFDESRGVKFSTFAAWWVRLAMQRAIEYQGGIVRMAVSRRELLNQINMTEKMLTKGSEKPSAAEVAEYLGLTVEEIFKAKASAIAAGPVSSLHAPVGEDGEGKLMDILEDKGSPSPSFNLDVAGESKDIAALFGSLDARAREVLTRRIGLDGDPETLETVGNALGLTRERVRQIEKQSLEKLATLYKRRA